MKFLDELFGFAVLSGPLWLILILLPVCIWLAIKISKRFKPGAPRIAGGVGILLLFFALPFGDEIVGRTYFNYLCATEAGVKVYKTVELPAEYWDERGRAKFYVNWDSHLGKTYPLKYKPGTYSLFFHIDNAGYEFVDAQSGQVLGAKKWGQIYFHGEVM